MPTLFIDDLHRGIIHLLLSRGQFYAFCSIECDVNSLIHFLVKLLGFRFLCFRQFIFVFQFGEPFGFFHRQPEMQETIAFKCWHG